MSQYYAMFPKQFTLRSIIWNAKDRKAVAGGSVLFKNGGSGKCRIELPDVEVSDTTNA